MSALAFAAMAFADVAAMIAVATATLFMLNGSGGGPYNLVPPFPKLMLVGTWVVASDASNSPARRQIVPAPLGPSRWRGGRYA